MKYSNCQEIDRFVRLLVGEGWIFRWGSKHGKIRSPDGRSSVVVPSTPSDWRSSRNFLRDVRRSGGQAPGFRGKGHGFMDS